MSKKIVCGIFSLLLFSCTNNDEKYPVNEEIYENGNRITVTYINDSTYRLIQYYDDDRPLSIVTKNNHHVEHGEYISYYLSGAIQDKGNYKEGEKYGFWYYYSEDGHLDKLVEYFGSILNRKVYFTENMQIDTNIDGRNLYFTVQPMQDTIYFGEPYILNIRLHTPLYRDGMEIFLVDDISYYLNFGEEHANFKNPIKCSGYDHALVIQDYQIGDNEVKGIIIDHYYEKKAMIPYYFSQKFYVKELDNGCIR